MKPYSMVQARPKRGPGGSQAGLRRVANLPRSMVKKLSMPLSRQRHTALPRAQSVFCLFCRSVLVQNLRMSCNRAMFKGVSGHTSVPTLHTSDDMRNAAIFIVALSLRKLTILARSKWRPSKHTRLADSLSCFAQQGSPEIPEHQ